MTVRTADTSEPYMKITTFQIVVDDMRNHCPVETVVTSKAPVITGFELGKVRIQ
jgi:hypothetical protein